MPTGVYLSLFYFALVERGGPGETQTVTNLVVEVNMTKLEMLRNRSRYWLRKIWWRVTMPVRRLLDIKYSRCEIDSIYDGINFHRAPTREEWLTIAQGVDWICDSMNLQWDVDFTVDEKVVEIYEFLGNHRDLHGDFTWEEVSKVLPNPFGDLLG